MGPTSRGSGRRKVVRAFRDGHREEWWALEVEAGPYGGERARRALFVVTPDPETLPDLATWYLTTNLPAPGTGREIESDLAPASVAEVVIRLYGLRMWVEQSYKKQVKHALGWSQYQVRGDLAIRRHWRLVCCAFSLCWWAYGRLPTDEPAETEEGPPAEPVERGKRRSRASWPEALRAVRAWLEPWIMLWRYWRAFTDLPPPPELKALLDRVFSGRGLHLYVR
jgi:hypothetical protein